MTGRHKSFYNDWAVDDLRYRLAALKEDRRDKKALVTKISAITGRHKSFYNDWTVSDLNHRLTALMEGYESGDDSGCAITGKDLFLGVKPRYHITAYFSKHIGDPGIPLECVVDTGNSGSALPANFMKKLGITTAKKTTVRLGGGEVEVERNKAMVYVRYKNCRPARIAMSFRNEKANTRGNLGMNWLLATRLSIN